MIYARGIEKEEGQTGRPTAMLSREILLTPALRLIPLLKVSFGFSKLPYTVPAKRMDVQK